MFSLKIILLEVAILENGISLRVELHKRFKGLFGSVKAVVYIAITTLVARDYASLVTKALNFFDRYAPRIYNFD